MTAPVIRVENLGKRYVLGPSQTGARYKTLRDGLTDAAKAPFRRLLGGKAPARANEDEFWALRDVSFTISQGDVVGIIGRNGAGKSTLLKILSRITEPTTGKIALRGRVASLLEVGTGFHPELTGRENIYLNGAILGMSRVEIKAKFDEIVDFAEVERFLDTPVKRYSSGMYVRLAFAVAAHLEPEILVVDEVLAVGDAQFQKKCLGKIGEVARGGRTVLFVSHSITALRSLCHTGICLEAGRIVSHGTISEAIDHYLLAQKHAVSGLKYNTRPEPPEPRLFFSGFSDPDPGRRPGLQHEFLRAVSAQAGDHGENGSDLGGQRPHPVAHRLCLLDGFGRLATPPVRLSARGLHSHLPAGPAAADRRPYSIDLALTIHNQEWIDAFSAACQFEIAHFDPYSSGFELTETYGMAHLPHEWGVPTFAS